MADLDSSRDIIIDPDDQTVISQRVVASYTTLTSRYDVLMRTILTQKSNV